MKSQEPAVREGSAPSGSKEEIYEHPAYGVVRLSTTQGGSGVLFGSDLQHGQQIRISISRASLHRSLSNDWIHGDNNPLVEFEMSASQFAQFITSNGNYSGTPVTLLTAPTDGGKVARMPGIKPVESKADMLRREIRESAERQLASLKVEIDRLGALIESGKTPKAELKDIHHKLSIRSSNMPSNIAFVVEQAEEALEKATVSAKIEVETFIANAAQRSGMALQIGTTGMLALSDEQVAASKA